MRIIAVDDVKESRYLLQKLLEGHGYAVETAGNGVDALEKARTSTPPPDMIITDVLMPRMDGFQLCRELKNDEKLKDVPVLFYSATYTDKKSQEFAMSIGAAGYIVKPIEPDEFIKTIKETLEKHERGELKPAEKPLEEYEYVKLHSERLMQKLEKKMLDLEREISERKRAEDVVRQSEERYRILVENAPIGIYYNDFYGKFLYGNKKAEGIVGYKREELIGKSFLKLKLLGLKDISRAAKLLAFSKLGKGTGPDEFVLNRKDGTKSIAKIFTKVVTIGGEKVVLGMAEDITERKKAEKKIRESEEKYRSLVESTEDSVYLVDWDCKYLFVNEKHLLRLGLPVDEVIGRTYGELHSPEEEKEFAEKVDDVFKTGKSAQHEHISRRDGRYILQTLSPVEDPEGRTTAVTVVSKDITGLKQAEKERERLINELEAKNTELERFTYTVSHDLRSPLITIRGFATILREDLEQGKTEDMESGLERIETAAAKMDHLLNDTLELSRIGRVANPPEDVPFGEIVKGALEQTAEQIKSSGVEVSVADGFPTVRVDRMRIEEVLVNLITNGIRYRGDQPSPKIDLGYRVEGDGKAKEQCSLLRTTE